MAEESAWWVDVVTPALLRHARGAYGRTMRRALEAAGHDDIPGNGLYVIGGLALGDGSLTSDDLLRQMRLTDEAGARLVDALVTGGYLSRDLDPDDPHRTLIALTDRGRAAAQIQGDARAAVDTQLAEACGPETVEAMRRGLATLCEINGSIPDPESRD